MVAYFIGGCICLGVEAGRRCILSMSGCVIECGRLRFGGGGGVFADFSGWQMCFRAGAVTFLVIVGGFVLGWRQDGGGLFHLADAFW